MLDLFLKLIDHLIALLKRHEETDRNLFYDYVKPAMDDFEKVHESLLASFGAYREVLSDIKYRLDSSHPVFQLIELDVRRVDHAVQKLIDLERLDDHPMIGNFVEEILCYVRTVRQLSLTGDGVTFVGGDPFEGPFLDALVERESPNRPVILSLYRSVVLLVDGFSGGAPGIRAELMTMTEEFIEELQISHGKVIREYGKVKDKLLAPK